ncbi:MAG: LLM class flavin-dependent oxidoreductase [Actinomycetota bacterium]|nr:LLM class flavin-dependent oxidoreductase [Actinomycetota bacterium]
MKISMFHLMPHRELPPDFEQKYKSVWVDPPFPELADAGRVGQYYNWTLDELTYAAERGLDGICVNEHHQNAYGFMPGPNLMGAALARATNGTDVALVQMGSTLPTTQPPIRVAEEYAMLDCISGGRLVAGMPLGSPMDANMIYGITPIEQRERYYEAHDLILRAWQSRDMFAWNGKYNQLGKVNLWPRPIQKPYPPVWVPGTGSYSTWDFSAKHDHCYCFLSYFGASAAEQTMAGFWNFVAEYGLKENPYRAGFLQLVAVSETDERAEQEYAEHVKYFYNKCLHIPPHYFGPPGHQDYRSLEKGIRSGRTGKLLEQLTRLKEYTYKDFVDNQFVIAGSPATVREQLREAARKLRVGNLMVLLHIGSMPHELTLKNIDLFADEVMPHIKDLWDDEPWQNEWWPESLRGPRQQFAPTTR